MTLSPISWWKQDTARNTFIYTQFLISLPFTLFNTYAIYQLQVTGFLIGTDAQGAPCTTYCLVPFGGGRLDLNSVLLYMNAMTFGFGGFIMIFLTAYADFWSKSTSMYLDNTNKNTIQEHKSLLVTFLIVCYGAFSTPAYWLRNSTLANFNSFIALYVIFGVLTFILIALLNIYIPHCMRQVKQREKEATPGADTTLSHIGRSGSNEATRKYGFAMSVFGTVAVALSAVLMLVIVIAIAKSLPGPGGQSAGLLVTTILGFLTMAGAIPAYFGLPSLPTKPYPEVGGWKIALLELLTPYREMFLRKRNMFFLLLAYTIYTDTLFVLYSITGQLYFIEIKPGTLEYSLYTLAGNLYYFILTIAFYIFQRRFKWDLGKCIIFGYALILIVPIWGCIGLANVDFGYKNRWEFYIQLLICYFSQSIVNPTFRLLFSELVPKGEEIMWFGLQVILSCATTWVNYVATGPLQNATHQLRFPLVLCLVFLIVPLVLECMRATMRLFKDERERLLREVDGKGDGSSEDERTEIAVSVK